jgi:cytochrome c oxidase assembly protein subunit 15
VTTTLAPPAADASLRDPSSALHRFAVFFAAFTLLHIKGGAMVVSTGSGMAFTDWPLARGSLWPPDMDLEDLFEHLHRVSGALVGLFGIGLALWIQKVDGRRWLRHLCWWLLALIVVQGGLGGLGVVLGQEGGRTWAPAAIGHGVLGQVTLSIQVVVAFAVSAAYREQVRGPADEVGTARRLAGVALGLVVTQLLLGAIFRHTNIQGVLWVHILMALVVSTAILIAAAHSSAKFGAAAPGFRRVGIWVNVLLLVQLALGFVTLGVRRFKDPSNIEYLGRSLLVSSHVLVGATLFLFATLLVAKAWRNLVPEALDR